MQVSGSQDRFVFLKDVVLRLASEICHHVPRRRMHNGSTEGTKSLELTFGRPAFKVLYLAQHQYEWQGVIAFLLASSLDIAH